MAATRALRPAVLLAYERVEAIGSIIVPSLHVRSAKMIQTYQQRHTDSDDTKTGARE